MLKKGAVLKPVDTETLLSHLEGLAQKHFSIRELRPQQKEVFAALAQSKQVLATLPTGAGKTLIYALGSLLFEDSVTVIVCPLIALMRDQLQRMNEAGISAAIVYSEQSEEERRVAYRNLLAGKTRLLLVSPERFALSGFQRFLRRLKLGMIVVDEVHCVVSWGHTFRPEYSQLAHLLKSLPSQRILALTATASTASRALIREMVFPRPDEVAEVLDKPLRENIKIEAVRVYSEDERWLALLRILKETESKRTILYFPRREQCQNAANELRKNGFNSVVYHAGLARELRRSVEDYLRHTDRSVVVCATLAFGMGIDLSDVRLIVVAGFPGNIEEMFQMMGRAGRKGEESRAVIVWSGSDPKRRAFQFDKMLPDAQQIVERLRALSAFFPGPNQTRLVPWTDLKPALRGLLKEGRDMQEGIETLSGVLSMLGAGGGLLLRRSDWVALEFKSPKTLFNLLAELPPGSSRRRLVLEWFVTRLNIEESFAGRWHAAFSIAEMTEEIQLSWEKIYEVLRFYSDKSSISVRIVTRDSVAEHLLFEGALSDVLARLPRYMKWRTALSQSLQALSSFVVAEGCRMQGAERIFVGGKSSLSNATRFRCGRCDLCQSGAGAVITGQRDRTAGALTATLPDHLI